MKNFARVALLLGVLACSSRVAPPPQLVGSFSCTTDGVNAGEAVRELLITHDAAQPLEIAIALSPSPDTTSTWSFVLDGTGSISISTRDSRAKCYLRGSGLGRTLSLRGSSNQPIMISLETLDAKVRASATVKPGASGSLSFSH